MITVTDEKFEAWCVVEIMGRKKFAGFVTEHVIGGSSFVRIDVPEITLDDGTQLPAFTKLFGSSSIYCLSPCTEETARAFVSEIRAESFHAYEAPRLSAPSRSTADADPNFDDDDHENFVDAHCDY